MQLGNTSALVGRTVLQKEAEFSFFEYLSSGKLPTKVVTCFVDAAIVAVLFAFGPSPRWVCWVPTCILATDRIRPAGIVCSLLLS